MFEKGRFSGAHIMSEEDGELEDENDDDDSFEPSDDDDEE
jgi:hypothetical protein